MATNVAGRGVFQSTIAQWAVLGLGAWVISGNEALSESLLRGLQHLLQPSGRAGALNDQRQPIVIHSMASTANSTRYLTTLFQVTVGASVCWGSYVILSTCLPEAVKELLPVTRKFFEQAVTSLGKGILDVREMLSEQILGLSTKQEELGEKQDATHNEVLGVKNDLGEMKLDLDQIHETMQRCETSLSEAEKRQSYTARGVRLLTRCVGALLPGNATLASELDSFSRAGEDFKQEEQPPEQPPQETPQQFQNEQPQQQQGLQQMSHQKLSDNRQQYTPIHPRSNLVVPATGPENERPASPLPKEQSLDEVRALLDMVRGSLIAAQH